jgi:hypothetical protein
VKKAVHSSGKQYAVIAGHRTETGPECLVIAYANENSLRELIEAVSIIAVGFSSREEAIASSRASVPSAAAPEEKMAVAMAGSTEKYQHRFHWSEWQEGIVSALGRAARFLAASYSEATSTAAVIFSSTNAVSKVIRLAMGCSA